MGANDLRLAMKRAFTPIERSEKIQSVDFPQEKAHIYFLLLELRKMQQKEESLFHDGKEYSAVELAEFVSKVWERMEREEDAILSDVLEKEKVPSACGFATALQLALSENWNTTPEFNTSAKEKIQEVFDATEEIRKILALPDDLFIRIYGKADFSEVSDQKKRERERVFSLLTPYQKRRERVIMKRKIDIHSRQKIQGEADVFRGNIRKNFGNLGNFMAA